MTDSQHNVKERQAHSLVAKPRLFLRLVLSRTKRFPTKDTLFGCAFPVGGLMLWSALYLKSLLGKIAEPTVEKRIDSDLWELTCQ